eukprot:3301858-Alexandrium_andersonii.AAC.1
MSPPTTIERGLLGFDLCKWERCEMALLGATILTLKPRQPLPSDATNAPPNPHADSFVGPSVVRPWQIPVRLSA